MRAFVDPQKIMGGNFGVDGHASADRLIPLVRAELERTFAGYSVIVEVGEERVVVEPDDHAVGTRALQVVAALRKTADYVVFVE